MSDERLLDDWITGFMYLTEETEPPRSYREWTAVSVVAAALQRKCFFPFGLDTFYPNMYIMLVGPPGVRKGTAMGPGYTILNSIGIKTAAQATTLQQLIRKLKATNYSDLDDEGVMHLHSSLTIFSKELTVFLGYNNKELMTYLCDWYDCEKRWTYETVSRGEDEIIGVWVNIIGATTPRLIQSSMPLDAVGGGLTSRFVIVYEERKGKVVPFQILTKDQINIKEALCQDLERIHLMKGPFKFTEKFYDQYVSWRLESEKNPPSFGDDRLAGYCERRAGHLLKLTMILSASRSSTMVLTEGDLARAIDLLQRAEKNMPYVFRGVGKSDIAELVANVMTFIAQRKRVTIQDLMKKFYFDADTWTMERALKVMAAQGFCKMLTVDEKDYIVHKSDPAFNVPRKEKKIKEK